MQPHMESVVRNVSWSYCDGGVAAAVFAACRAV
jgi:hypothetical protein